MVTMLSWEAPGAWSGAGWRPRSKSLPWEHGQHGRGCSGAVGNHGRRVCPGSMVSMVGAAREGPAMDSHASCQPLADPCSRKCRQK
eukprot:2396659-Alexandrium_andersonii.AAC.1